MICTSLLSSFQAKRDELLQFAQCAISGLKINSEIARLTNSFGEIEEGAVSVSTFA